MKQQQNSFIEYIDKSIEIGLYILVFIVPLFFSKYTKQNFLLSKECFISFMILVLLSLWLIKIILNTNNKIVASPFTFAILIFYFINFLSIFQAENTTISVYAFYLFANYAALFFIMLYNIRSIKQIKIMLTMFCLTAGFVSFYGICQFFDIDPIFSVGEVKGNTGRSKVFSTFGNPTFLADYLVVVLPISIGYYIDKYRPRNMLDFLKSIGFVACGYALLYLYAQGYGLTSVVLLIAFIVSICMYLFRGKQRKQDNRIMNKLYGLIGAFSFVSIFLCIVITRTRGAWLGVFFSFIFTMVILLFVEREKMLQLLKYTTVLIVILVLFLSGLYYLPTTHDNMDRIISMMKHRFISSSTIIQRFLMWRVGLDMLRSSNYKGNGIGNFKVIYSGYQEKFLARDDIDDRYRKEAVCFRHAHNEYVHMLTEIGVLGLLAFFYLFFIFFRESYYLLKRKDDFFIDMGMIAGVSAVLIQSVFNFPFHRATPTLTVFSLMAFVALKKKSRISQIEIHNEAEKDIVEPYSWFKHPMFKRIAGGISLIIIFSVFLPRVYGYFEGSKDLKSGYIFITSPCPADQREPRLRKAIELLKRSLKLDPSDREGEAHYWTGIAYEELGEYDKALEWYMKALEYTQNKLVFFHIGLIHMRMRNFEKAKEYLSRTVGIVPKFVDGYFNLALIDLQEKNFDNAIKNLKNVMFYKRDYAATYQYLGEIYYKQKNYVDAAYYYSIFSDITAQQTNIAEDQQQKDKFLNLQKLISFSYKEIIGKYSADIKDRDIIDDQSDYFSHHENEVQKLWHKEFKMKKEFDESVEKLNNIYNGFSDIYKVKQEHRIPFLAESYKRFPKMKRTYPKEIKKIFEFLVFQKDVIETLQDLFEKNASLLEACGYYFINKHRYTKAAVCFGRYIKQLDPSDQSYQKTIKLLVNCCEKSMFSRLQRISQMLPYDDQFHYNLGVDLFNKRKYTDAIEEWDQILKYKPVSIKPLFQRGLANYKLKKYNKALADWKKIVQIAPETAEGKQAQKYIFEIQNLIKN